MDPKLIEKLHLFLAAGIEPPAELFGDVPREEIRAAVADAPVFFRAATLMRKADDSNPDAMTRTYVASAEAVDRAGDLVQIRASRKEIEFRGKTIKPEGMKVQNFKDAGAPVLWAHNRKQDLPPVGRVTKFKVSTVFDPAQGKNVPAMLETVEFTPHEDFPMSKTIAHLALVTKGLNTVSQGFVPEVGIWVEDAKERDKLGLGPWGQHFMQSDQIELSMTPTPMLPLAVGVEGKAWQDLLDADVARGMKQLVERGIIKQSVHDDLLPMLVPIDGDVRARDRVRGFVEFNSAKAADGAWPCSPPTYEGLLADDDKTLEACKARFTGEVPSANPEPEARAADPVEDPETGAEGALATARRAIDGIGAAMGVGAPDEGSEGTPASASTTDAALGRTAEESDLDAILTVLRGDGPILTPAEGLERARTIRAQHTTRGQLIERIAESLGITGAAPEAFVDAIQRLRESASVDREVGAGISTADCARIEGAVERIADAENELSAVIDSVRSRQGVELADAGPTLLADRLVRSLEGLTQALSERGVEIDDGGSPSRQVPRAARSDDTPETRDPIDDMIGRARAAIDAAVAAGVGGQSPTGA